MSLAFIVLDYDLGKSESQVRIKVVLLLLRGVRAEHHALVIIRRLLSLSSTRKKFEVGSFIRVRNMFRLLSGPGPVETAHRLGVADVWDVYYRRVQAWVAEQCLPLGTVQTSPCPGPRLAWSRDCVRGPLALELLHRA